MHPVKRLAVFLLAALAAVPAFAADLVTVTTEVTHATAVRGGSNQGTVLINNNVNADVRVRLNVHVVFSDGSIQRLTGIPDPGTLPPGGGFFQSVTFIIPPDAPLGPAMFVSEVNASSGRQQETETGSAGFEVVAQ